MSITPRPARIWNSSKTLAEKETEPILGFTSQAVNPPSENGPILSDATPKATETSMFVTQPSASMQPSTKGDNCVIIAPISRLIYGHAIHTIPARNVSLNDFGALLMDKSLDFTALIKWLDMQEICIKVSAPQYARIKLLRDNVAKVSLVKCHNLMKDAVVRQLALMFKMSSSQVSFLCYFGPLLKF